MTRARDIADLVDSNGDIVAGALDNVPASNDASALTTGTLDNARLASGAAVSNLGFTPINVAGGTLTGTLNLNSLNVQGGQRKIRTWEWNNASLNQNTNTNLIYNSSSYTDVHFLLTLEGFHSGRSYAMYAGTFGGYGLNHQLIGGSTSCSLSVGTHSTGKKYLRASTSSLTGGSGTFHFHMTIYGDSGITVVNGAMV